MNHRRRGEENRRGRGASPEKTVLAGVDLLFWGGVIDFKFFYAEKYPLFLSTLKASIFAFGERAGEGRLLLMFRFYLDVQYKWWKSWRLPTSGTTTKPIESRRCQGVGRSGVLNKRIIWCVWSRSPSTVPRALCQKACSYLCLDCFGL